MREYLEALVSRQGYQAYPVSSGEEALRSLDHTRPDLVTLDVVLDGMDGIETLRRLKKRMPDVPVVMLSGHGHARTIVEAMRSAPRDFLASRSRSRSWSSPSRARSRPARCAARSRSCAVGDARFGHELLLAGATTAT